MKKIVALTVFFTFLLAFTGHATEVPFAQPLMNSERFKEGFKFFYLIAVGSMWLITSLGWLYLALGYNECPTVNKEKGKKEVGCAKGMCGFLSIVSFIGLCIMLCFG